MGISNAGARTLLAVLCLSFVIPTAFAQTPKAALSYEEKKRQTRNRLHKLTTLAHVEKKITFCYEMDALLAGGLARLDVTLAQGEPVRF